MKVVRFGIASVALLGIACTLYPVLLLMRRTAAHPSLWELSEYQQEVVYALLVAATALLASCLALWIALRAFTSRPNRMFALFLGMFGIAGADEGRFAFIGWMLPGPGGLPFVAAEVLFGLSFAACLASAVRWAALYPAGDRRLGRAIAALAAPSFGWLALGAGSAVAIVTAGITRDRTLVQIVCAVAALGIAAVLLHDTYRRGSIELRRRMYWLLQAVLGSLLLLGLSLPIEFQVHAVRSSGFVVSWLHVVLLPLALLTLISFLCVAVLYAGAMDPVLVVRRTLLYSSAGLIVTSLFVAVETAVSVIVENWIALPGVLASWVAGVCAAVAFGPVRSWVDRGLKMAPREHAQRPDR